MTMTYLISMKSKDPSSRVGAVIVGPDKEVRSTGYNGLPRSVDDIPSRYDDREYKLYAINHAEENAIIHCARTGTSTKDCTLYTHWFPCSACAKSIIQAGIIEVVHDKHHPSHSVEQQGPWQRSLEISRELLLEANVQIREFDGELIKIRGLYREAQYDPFARS